MISRESPGKNKALYDLPGISREEECMIVDGTLTLEQLVMRVGDVLCCR